MKRSTVLVVFLVLVCTSVRAASGPFNGKVAFTSSRDGNQEIYSMLPSGVAQTRLTKNAASDSHPSWSPDGTKIAFMTDRDGNEEIYVMNADGTNQTRVTNNAGPDLHPTWSPDGQKIAFASARGATFDIFIINADGSGVEQLTDDPAFDYDPAFSPKGAKIAFTSSRDGNFEIYSMNPDGTSQTRLTNNTQFDTRPDFSPNGQKIVYATMVPGGAGGLTQQVAIMSSNGANQTVLTSAGANGNPAFSADGTRILFDSTRDLNREIYSMLLDGTSAFRMTNNPASDVTPSSQRAFQPETTGVYRPSLGRWFLRTSNISGPPNLTLNFGGQAGDLPIAGNWNGDDRTDIGIFRSGTFILGVVESFFGLEVVQELPPITFGQAGDLPVAGDWDGDGTDDIGVFRPGATGTFLLRKPRVNFPFGFTTVSVNFGTTGDLPVAGDWDGDGIETPGVYRPDKFGLFLLTNGFDSTAEIVFAFGNFQLPLAGDWLGVGIDNVGLFEPTAGMFLTTTFSADVAFTVEFGQPGDLPVAGNWTP